MFLRSSILALCILVSSQASAAIVGDIDGTVWIDRGQGEAASATSATVEPGNRIRAGNNSSATIYFDNGCSTRIEAGQTIVVPAQPTCAAANSLGGSGTEALVVGGVLIGGGTAAIIALSQDDDSKPASP